MTEDLISNVCNKLEECEEVIERGLQTFIEVGFALSTIRDFRLYKFKYRTFEIYLHRRWDISKSRAYQMIDASTVTRQMSTIVDAELPATESQARELVGLDTEVAARVMRETVNRVRGKVTAKAIRETRERIANPKPPAPKPPSKPPVTERDVHDDHAYCGDEDWWKKQALAVWDADSPDELFGVNGTFRVLLDLHSDCCDPYVMAGQWASWLHAERAANGGLLLMSLAIEIAGMASEMVGVMASEMVGVMASV